MPVVTAEAPGGCGAPGAGSSLLCEDASGPGR